MNKVFFRGNYYINSEMLGALIIQIVEKWTKKLDINLILQFQEMLHRNNLIKSSGPFIADYSVWALLIVEGHSDLQMLTSI